MNDFCYLYRTVGTVRRGALCIVGVMALLAVDYTPAKAEISGAGAVASPRAQEAPVQLIMVEAEGCRFCAQWHAEIGPAYSKTPEGRFAPLVRVGRNALEIQGLKPVIYTPTFIVMRGSAEVARLAGYPGQNYFWEELRGVLAPAGFVPTSQDRR